ncbi:formate acetyltransferase [bacterium]|nr:formate acetyltransferase [bacterium]
MILSTRFQRIKNELLSYPIHLCIERARLVTEYFKQFDNANEPMVIRKAKAFRHLMRKKSIKIYPDELIVGNIGKYRKSAIMQPELSGVFSCQELLWIDKRKTTPFKISWGDRLKLLKGVIPYWLPRNMIIRAFWPDLKHLSQYIVDQLNPNYYLINEVAGIGHFIPHYEKAIKIGLKGYLEQLKNGKTDLFRAMAITAEAVIDYSNRMSCEIERLVQLETDKKRSQELVSLAEICKKVPENPAETFHEALQALWICHMAVCLEGVNSAVSFGRLDQILYPYYKKDLETGRITPQQAKKLLLCFSAKTTEHVFLISEKMSKYHGGFLVAQAAIVGGIDSRGENAVNDLSWILLDVMEESGLRDPNYQVRIHKNTPSEFIRRALDVARKGTGSPAFFCDEATVSSLTAHGYSEEEANTYGIVGCVEPTIPSRSFCSTDAALVNLPVCLELALNQGKRINGRKQIGINTRNPGLFHDMEDVITAFEKQVSHLVKRLIRDIQVIEKGNRNYHPTPFSSMLVDGCIENNKDITAGGAQYNSSGIQGVGVADVSDSLAAIEEVVFQNKRFSLKEIIDALKTNFDQNEPLRSYLVKATKFGNDHGSVDRFAERTMCIFHAALGNHQNSRGGPYIPGFYSSTCHVGFGEQTAALPSGRKAGQPFAASMSAGNGMDRSGPTAVLNSVASTDPRLSPNGYALNLSFDPHTLKGEKGVMILDSLLRGYFEKGGMELQLNVLDHQVLEDALNNPGKHPGIVVRVAGYCAFFDDLPHEVKKEVINRNRT